jgi:hypothetical protein
VDEVRETRLCPDDRGRTAQALVEATVVGVGLVEVETGLARYAERIADSRRPRQMAASRERR